MKKINVKSVLIFTLLIASALATPVMATGYGNDDDTYNFEQAIDSPDDLLNVFGGFGSMFSGLGYGGQLIGRVLQMLLMQTLGNFSQAEIMPGVFVLSAFTEEEIGFVKDFGAGEYDYYLPSYNYDQTPVVDVNEGSAYCEVKKEGWAQVNITVGAGVTLLIYDQDLSFITAIKKIINFVNRLMNRDLGSMTDAEQEELIHDGVETLTWFLIHINDIFTGEELIALNPITWQSMQITPDDATFNLTKTWKVTGPNWNIGDGDDEILSEATVTGADAMLASWNATAKAKKDSLMQWLLRPTDDASLVESHFTAFTFDLIQLWIKNFEIHIDAAAIIDLIGGAGGTPTQIADIFRGLDIEFYLFTHHLAGAFLYNDSNGDGQISSSYRDVTVGNETLTINDVPVQVPDASEITHRIMLGTVDDFTFELPHVTGSNKISWGLTLNSPTIIPVPVGVDLNSYLGATPEDLQYIHFGFSFQPREVAAGILHAPVKLDQFFAPWNDPDAPYSNNDIAGLDMGIIYLSTMLHFHLNVATIGEDPEDPTTLLDPADDYNNETHTLKVGNYLGKAFQDELAFVDIAGPEYLYGAEGTTDTAPASSAIIPLALYEGEVERHDTFLPSEGSETLAFATDVRLNVSFNVMAYAVCFPMFEDGSGIWHDPTFSVFMVFEVQGFWALILLIAGVGLVGIATILIKKRKDARF